MYLIPSKLAVVYDSVSELHLSSALLDPIFEFSFIRKPFCINCRIRIESSPSVILVRFPFAWIFQLPLSEKTLSLPLYPVVSPLTIIERPIFLELIPALSVLKGSFFLTNIFPADIFVINLMHSVQLICILILASHTAPNLACVTTIYGHTGIVGTYITLV